MSAVVKAMWSAQADELIHTTTRALLFSLGDTTYGLSVEYVERVIELPSVISVPRASDWLVGLAVYESTPLPLIDLRYFLQPQQFTMKPEDQAMPGRAIAVNCAHGKVLLAVDQLVTIADLSGRQHVVTTRPEFPEQFMEFACKTDETIIGVVCMPKLLLAAGKQSAVQVKPMVQTGDLL